MPLWCGFPTYGLDTGVKIPDMKQRTVLIWYELPYKLLLAQNCTNHISRSITSFGPINSVKWLKKIKVAETVTASIIRRLIPNQKALLTLPSPFTTTTTTPKYAGSNPTRNKPVALWNFSWAPFFPFCSNSIWRCNSEKNPEAHSRCCGLPPRDCSTVGWSYERSEKYVVPPCVLCRNYTINKYALWSWWPRCPTMHV